LAEIVLTGDRTIMSNHHHKEFLGFAATLPPNIIPEWLFRFMIFPKLNTVKGVPVEAPYGLRKIEAKLLEEGYDVVIVAPDHLKKYISKARVLGIYTMDPFGWGPSSSTFARLLKTGDCYLAKYFRALLQKPEIRAAKKNNDLKIIVGGPGAWQFKYKPEFVRAHGIDCVLQGEAENVIKSLLEKLLNGVSNLDTPLFYEAGTDEVPTIAQIPDIRGASINGLIEIGRGCLRGCKFCDVTLRPQRWYTYDKIERELQVNVRAGVRNGILHAEDVLLYGSRNLIPNEKKILKLCALTRKYYKVFHWSHTSMAAVAAAPDLVERCGELILECQSWWGAEIGIETASTRLLRKLMPAKAYPFELEEWSEVVQRACGIMHDNNLVPAITLITGLPEETEDDTLHTIELIDNLKQYRSIIVPLFFVPLGRLKHEDWFKDEDITELQSELLKRCLNHSIYWGNRFAREYMRELWYGKALLPLYWLGLKAMEYVAKQKGVLLEDYMGTRRQG
jgi:radical SAM superfamily enzyme YgiQ (UPF0313 family)